MSDIERSFKLGEEFPLFAPEGISEYREGRKQVPQTRIALEMDNLPAIPFWVFGNHYYDENEESLKPSDMTKPDSDPLYLEARCSDYELSEVGLSSEEKYKKEHWYVIQDEVMHIIDRLRLQAIFPNGEIYESQATLLSTRTGSLNFVRFYPSNQPPRINEWVNAASLKDTIFGGQVGKPLALYDDESDDSRLAAVKVRFVLADDNSTSADFRIKTHLAHVQHEAKHVFYIDIRDRFSADQRLRLKEGFSYWGISNIPFMQLIEHLSQGYTSPRINILLRQQLLLRNSVSLDGGDYLITDGRVFLKEDLGEYGVVAGLERSTYYAILNGPVEEYALAVNPGRSDFTIALSLRKMGLQTSLKAADLSLPENFSWRYSGV